MVHLLNLHLMFPVYIQNNHKYSVKKEAFGRYYCNIKYSETQKVVFTI